MVLFTKEYLPTSIIEGKIGGSVEVTGRRRRKRKQLLDIWETRGYRKLKKEAPDRTVWRSRFGRRYGSVVRETILRNSGNDVPVNTAVKFVSQEPTTEPHASPLLDAPVIGTRVIAVCKEGA